MRAPIAPPCWIGIPLSLSNMPALTLALQLLAAVLATLVLFATVITSIGASVWWIRVFDFPRLQVLALACVVAVGLYLLLPDFPRLRWGSLAVMVACVVAQIYQVLPYTIVHGVQVETTEARDDGRDITVLIANIFMENRDAAALRELVRARDPDVIAIVEPDGWWQEQLESLEASYPHTVLVPQDDTYGMFLYSRLPLGDPTVEFIMEPSVPSIHTRVTLESGDEVALHILHPKPPVPGESTDTEERDAELLRVGKRVARRDLPTIVAGDLNDVAWSSTTKLFQKVSGLLDPRIGRGFFNSYNAHHWFLRFPLDHVFHSDDFLMVSIERLPPIGSDHFPLFVHLALTPSAPAVQDAPQASQEDKAEAQEKIAKPHT